MHIYVPLVLCLLIGILNIDYSFSASIAEMAKKKKIARAKKARKQIDFNIVGLDDIVFEKDRSSKKEKKARKHKTSTEVDFEIDLSGFMEDNAEIEQEEPENSEEEDTEEETVEEAEENTEESINEGVPEFVENYPVEEAIITDTDPILLQQPDNQEIITQTPMQTVTPPYPSSSSNYGNQNGGYGEDFPVDNRKNHAPSYQMNQNYNENTQNPSGNMQNNFDSQVSQPQISQSLPVNTSYAGSVDSTDNHPDSLIIEETINYLKQLGVVNESKLESMTFGDTELGVCLLCKKDGIVHKIGGQSMYGICTDCIKNSIARNNSITIPTLNAGTGNNNINYAQNNGNSPQAVNGMNNYGNNNSVPYADNSNNNGGSYDQSGSNNGGNSNSSGGIVGGIESALQNVPGGIGGLLGGLFGGKTDQSHESDNGYPRENNNPTANQMVLDANGNLVPLNSLVGSAAPYGYIMDLATGQMRPATSLAEGLSAASGGTSGAVTTTTTIVAPSAASQMVLDATGRLVPLSSITPRVIWICERC